MTYCKSILLPLAVTTLFIGHSGAAFAAAGQMSANEAAALSSVSEDDRKEICRSRSFGPSHHRFKRTRSSGCTGKKQENLANFSRDCQVSSHGPRHVTLHARRSNCTKGDAPIYAEAGRSNEDGN